MTNQLTSPEFLRTAGFLLVDDIGMTVMDDALNLAPARIPDSQIHLVDESAPVGLANVAHQLHGQFVKKYGEILKPAERTRLGLLDELHYDGSYMFKAGYGDLDFTWHFAPAIANATVDSLVDAGEITPDEKSSLTLGDYANIIGSGWFSGLIHDMAITRNGQYGKFGTKWGDYSRDALRTHMFDQIGDIDPYALDHIFEPAIKTETDELGVTISYTTVALTSVYRKYIRGKMTERTDEPRHVGCPIARHAGAVSAELLTENTHAKRLGARGFLELEAENDGKVRFRQEITPIDLSLMVLADKLDMYSNIHGEPVLVEKGDRKKGAHAKRTASELLWTVVQAQA